MLNFVGRGLVALALSAASFAASNGAAPSMADILAASPEADWQPLDPDRLLVMTLASAAEVLIYLAPDAAPNTVKNIRELAAARYYDGLALLRVQDNYVAQWGDPAGDSPQAKSRGRVGDTLAAEFDVPAPGRNFVPLRARDAYALSVGFWDGFPAARDIKTKRAWLTHCYGMVGVGRGGTADSGNGAELYAVIGHAPRHLDRNVTIVGRVISGIENLSGQPRGRAALGFYEKDQPMPKIASVVLASQMDSAARPKYARLRTSSPTFATLVESRRNRRDDWFLYAADAIDLCNVPLPVRPIK